MESRSKKILGFVAVGASLLFLTGCNSFCDVSDISNVRYRIDPINTRYIPKEYLENENLPQLIYEDQNGFEVNLKDLKDNSGNKILAPLPGNDNLYYIRSTQYVVTTLNESGTNYNQKMMSFGLNSTVLNTINQATQTGYKVPSFSYWEKQDEKLLNYTIKQENLDKKTLTFEEIYGYPYEVYARYYELYDKSHETSLTSDEKEEKEILAQALLAGKSRELSNNKAYYDKFVGYVNTDAPNYIKEIKDEIITNNEISFVGKLNSNLEKHSSIKHSTNNTTNNDYWDQIILWDNEIRKEIGDQNCLNSDFLKIYKNNLNNSVAQFRSCISIDNGYYGHFGDDELTDTIYISDKTGNNFWDGWGDAFNIGFLEGLLVYPIGTMVESFSHSFGMNGWGQIGAVLLATLIVRLFFMLITLPSTISQQKMQYLQPEIARLQQKYPNSTTNEYDKQNFAKEQMALYKKHKVHPFMSLLVMIVQFPIFISVWNALQGCASLSSDAVLGLRLSDSIWSVLSNVAGWPNVSGWWTALVLILLMSAAQILAMLLPNWLNKSRMKKVQKLNKNAEADKQQKQMKIMQYVMTGMIIFMGFSLPAAMGVYWLAGALFGMIQTLIIHFVFNKKGLKK